MFEKRIDKYNPSVVIVTYRLQNPFTDTLTPTKTRRLPSYLNDEEIETSLAGDHY